MGSHAVPAVHALAVGELARVLHEEARLAHELVRLLGQHLGCVGGAVLGVRDLVLVLFLLGDDEALFQDDVEAGLHVVVVHIVVVIDVVLVLGRHHRGHRHDDGFVGLFVVDDRICVVIVVAQDRLVGELVVVQVLEFGLVEVFGLIDFVFNEVFF
jgi:hypothetical protein